MIEFVVFDTITSNTGGHNEVVKIQKKMFEMRLIAPQYIGCQQYILDKSFEAYSRILFRKI